MRYPEERKLRNAELLRGDARRYFERMMTRLMDGAAFVLGNEQQQYLFRRLGLTFSTGTRQRGKKKKKKNKKQQRRTYGKMLSRGFSEFV